MPALEATNFGLVWHGFADPVPSIVTVLLDQAAQCEVLRLSPDHFVVRRLRLSFVELAWTCVGTVRSSLTQKVNWVSFRIEVTKSSVFKPLDLADFSRIQVLISQHLLLGHLDAAVRILTIAFV